MRWNILIILIYATLLTSCWTQKSDSFEGDWMQITPINSHSDLSELIISKNGDNFIVENIAPTSSGVSPQKLPASYNKEQNKLVYMEMNIPIELIIDEKTGHLISSLFGEYEKVGIDEIKKTSILDNNFIVAFIKKIFSSNAVTETVTDADGNVYHTVSIGTQTWTVENLRTTKYNDGTAIPLVTDGTAWSNLTTPGYCWYNNDVTAYKTTYGALYNWNAVATGKLAPAGWHVPTDAEWSTLSTYLGGDNVAGGKLKEVGTTHWSTPNTGTTNETGFSALPGGCRDGDGDFNDVGDDGYWWSATEYDASTAYLRDLLYGYYGLGSRGYSKSCGFSVRLVRD